MTQRQLAVMLGVSPQFISKWLAGKCNLSVSTAMRWASILKIDFGVLVMAVPDAKTRAKLIGFERGKRGRPIKLSDKTGRLGTRHI